MNIRLGYEIGTGRAVDIPADRHVAISGQTQRSGKTTTLEALIHRSGLRAVAFVTKRAEASFRSATPVAPYFRDSADWQFVSSILEAMMGERMKFERSWIIDACRGAEGLAGVMANVKKRLHGVPASKRGKWQIKPAQGLNRSVLTSLEAYLEIVIPQIARLPYTKSLANLLTDGLNVMDLSDYSTELQQLVIRSVLEWVYLHERNTIVVIPEAWEFIPQNRRSPVLLAAEELIRKGAAAGNFVWLDSQDMAAVHKNVLRSVGAWILGVQREQNEVERTLRCLPVSPRPKPAEIMELGRGQFFVAWEREVRRVYVQPFWISDAHAAAIARGEEDVASAEKIWREQHARNGAPVALEQSIAEAAAPAGGEHCGNYVAEPEDDMEWKERAQQLEGEVISLRQEVQRLNNLLLSHGSSSLAAQRSPLKLEVKAISLDGNFAEFVRRLREHPETIALLAERPTIELRIERPKITADTKGDNGRLALMIHEGFFAKPRAISDATAEFRRRGWMEITGRPRPLNVCLGKLAQMGFLTIEPNGYLAVPGMKIATKEA